MQLSAGNSLFGKYYTPNYGSKTKYIDKEESRNLIKDFLGRESKTYKEIKKNEEYVNYLYEGANYVNIKNNYILTELEKLKEPARNIYKEALERGYTQEEAKKLTNEFINKEKKNILMDVDSIFV